MFSLLCVQQNMIHIIDVILFNVAHCSFINIPRNNLSKVSMHALLHDLSYKYSNNNILQNNLSRTAT